MRPFTAGMRSIPSNEAWRHRFRHLYELRLYEELLESVTNDWLAKRLGAASSIAEINAISISPGAPPQTCVDLTQLFVLR